MRLRRRSAAAAATCSVLVSLTAAGDALADSTVRFLHAVPGAPGATLTVSGGKGPEATIKDITFAKPSATAPGPSGPVTVSLTVDGKKVASRRADLASGGSYTIVAEKGRGKALRFVVYRAAKARAGKVLIRAVHAAPEVGRVNMTLGKKSWGAVSYGQDTGYEAAAPGTYTLAARKAGDPSPIVKADGVTAAAGTAATAYAVGSAGQPTKLVLVQDSVAAPSKGPATGLGGMAGDGDGGGTPWLPALLAALLAGALGAAVYLRAPLLRGRGRS